MLIDKMTFFAQCLDDCGVAEVYVQHVPGLDVPATVAIPAKLEYGWNMPVRIHDLTWNAVGISATLSFDQTPYETFVPWTSIIAMAPKGQGLIVAWDFCVPASVQNKVTLLPSAPAANQKTAREKSEPRAAQKISLSIVKDHP